MKRENEKNSLELNELIQLATQGNQDAFKLILDDYNDLIQQWTRNAVKSAGYVCRDSAEIEDLYQIARTVFSMCLNAYKAPNNFLAYSHACVVHGLQNEFRRNRSNKGAISHNALYLDKNIKDEDMSFIDLVPNNHPEFEGVYCVDYKNPKVIREILEEKFDEEQLKIYDLRCEGYKFNEISEKLQIKEKSAAYCMKNMEKFCYETLTKKK